jgi:hypothetical protein
MFISIFSKYLINNKLIFGFLFIINVSVFYFIFQANQLNSRARLDFDINFDKLSYFNCDFYSSSENSKKCNSNYLVNKNAFMNDFKIALSSFKFKNEFNSNVKINELNVIPSKIFVSRDPYLHRVTLLLYTNDKYEVSLYKNLFQATLVEKYKSLLKRRLTNVNNIHFRDNCKKNIIDNILIISNFKHHYLKDNLFKSTLIEQISNNNIDIINELCNELKLNIRPYYDLKTIEHINFESDLNLTRPLDNFILLSLSIFISLLLTIVVVVWCFNLKILK